MVHIVRNSIDHGIEQPQERVKLNKREAGTVFLEASHEGGEVWITIRDDGRGLDREAILAKAKKQGLLNGEGENLSDDDIFKFIFEPGFSTAAKITDISGRGVGMDVVRRNLEKLKGSVNIQSKMGKGTTITLRIPLTLALIDGMVIQVGANKYMLPLLSIRESFKPKAEDITVTMDGQEIVNIRGELIPVIRLQDLQGITAEKDDLEKGILIIVKHVHKSYCLAVDNILGQQQTVIKGLSDYMGDIPGISGCTILGDGRVSLILDVGELVNAVIHSKKST